VEVIAPKRVCLLTGASGRLGTAFCRRNASRYDIVAVYHSRIPQLVSQASSLADPLAPEAEPGENEHPVFTVRADLTCDEDIDRLVEVTLARFGRIDLLVNCAACSTRERAVDQHLFPASLERHLATNVLAPARLALAVARAYWQDRPEENRMRNRNVVNVSSTAGLYVYPGVGQAAYGTSKAALNFLTVHLASEFRLLNIRVNATAPNTFPQLVPTRRVLDSIVRLDQGQMTGEILLLDTDEESFL
jgi:NAD(P)-dependent dehydrogenase (short-subunit alcohol dehydrogenase family)